MPFARPPITTRFEPLESRTLLSGPSPREQQMLELINRMRAKPADELPLLLNARDPDVQNALNFFKVDLRQLASDWAGLTPAAPLAWNEALSKAALTHTQKMLATDRQSHQLPGEAALLGRAQAAGYRDAAFVGENVFAYMESVPHGHAGFAIDWGNGPKGLQTPAGHRNNLMSGAYTEVGLAVIDGKAGKSTGPLLVTQDFGSRRGQRPFLLGVVYDDKNRDKCYTPGEGVADATVVASGKAGTFVVSTMTAGGYQMQLPPGTYTLTASGGSLKGLATIGNVTIADANVKRDFLRPAFRADTAGPRATLATATGAAANVAGGAFDHTFTVNYADNAAVKANTLSNGDVRVTGPNGFSGVAQLVSVDRGSNGPGRTATYRVAAPGGFFDSADNGQYAVMLQPNQVADNNGNFAPAAKVGHFSVNVARAVLVGNGTLVVNGTAGDDRLDLSLTGQTLTVKVNNTAPYTFDYRKVKRVFVSALEGNDSVSVGAGIMGAVIDGGIGNDTLSGGAGADTINGHVGNDVLLGNAGEDWLTGGAGFDTVNGGAGRDRAGRDRDDLFSDVDLLPFG
jgi:hypothetical protein